MYDEPRTIPPRPTPNGGPDEVSGRSVAALIFGVLGLAHVCPCVGPVIAIALGMGRRDGVGRAAVVVGAIGLGVDVLLALSAGALLLKTILFEIVS
jgi:cytochrome c biogenesis protein CcdA